MEKRTKIIIIVVISAVIIGLLIYFMKKRKKEETAKKTATTTPAKPGKRALAGEVSLSTGKPKTQLKNLTSIKAPVEKTS